MKEYVKGKRYGAWAGNERGYTEDTTRNGRCDFMTDDAVFDGWYNRRFSNRESDDCGHGREDMLEACQAATTVLLEKLKSEGIIMAIATAIDSGCFILPDEEKSEYYRLHNQVNEIRRKQAKDKARAVIEALEKELVG